MDTRTSRTFLLTLVALGAIGLSGAPASSQLRPPTATGVMKSTGTFIPLQQLQVLGNADVDEDAPLRPVLNGRALTEEEYTFLKNRQGPHARFKPGIPSGGGSGIGPLISGYLYETPGLNGYESPWTPPDDSLAVGNNSAIEPANDIVGIFNRNSSGLVLQSLTDANSFMNVSPLFTTPYDPRAMYDYKTGHFFISYTDFPYQDANGVWHADFLLAVSKSSDAFGPWVNYLFNYDTIDPNLPASEIPALFDYPDIGMDANNVYVTANIFGAQDYLNSTLIAFDKTALEAGKPKVAAAIFDNLTGTLTPPYVWSQGKTKQTYFIYDQPTSIGPTSTTGYVGMYAVTGKVKDGSIKLSNPYNVVVPYYDYPAAAEAPGYYPIDSSDTRFEDKTQQQSENVFAVNCVGLLGFPMITAYEMNGATAQLVQSVNMITSATSFDYNASIAVNSSGTAVVNWNSTDVSKTLAANNIYQSIRSVTLGKTWGKKALSGSLVPGATSTEPYMLDFHNNGYRNGDYSMTMVDPIYDQQFWAINQTVYDFYDWNTYIFELSVK